MGGVSGFVGVGDSCLEVCGVSLGGNVECRLCGRSASLMKEFRYGKRFNAYAKLVTLIAIASNVWTGESDVVEERG